jgi:hypothetical protein
MSDWRLSQANGGPAAHVRIVLAHALHNLTCGDRSRRPYNLKRAAYRLVWRETIRKADRVGSVRSWALAIEGDDA